MKSSHGNISQIDEHHLLTDCEPLNPDVKPRPKAGILSPAILTFLSLLFYAVSIKGEDVEQYCARTWQADDGLPRNTITSIAQTGDGYLWLGTPFGVIRFDGVSFTPMSEHSNGNFGRVRTRVLYADANDRLWIGTGTEGMVRWSATGGSKVINHNNGLPHPTVNAFCEDQQMKLWVATGDGQVSWLDENDTAHPTGYVLGQPGTEAIQLVRDRLGTLWFAKGSAYGQLIEGSATNVTRTKGEVALCPSRYGGVWLFSGQNLCCIDEHQTVARQVFTNFPAKLKQVALMFEDRHGNLWLGTRNQGLYRYANGNVTREIDTPYRILTMFQDREDNLWVGTDGEGLIRLRPRFFFTVSPHEALPNFPVFSVCADPDGDVWMSPQGVGLSQWKKGHLSENFPALETIGTTVVFPNPKGGVLVGTINHGLYLIDAERQQCLTDVDAFRDRQIRALHRDDQGNLWLGCLPDGLAKISPEKIILPDYFFAQGLPHAAILSMTTDRTGRLWLGTIRGELYAYDGKQFHRFDKTDGLPGNALSALCASTNGDLWIGTLGGGLGRRHAGRFIFCDTHNGLADDVIAAIVDSGDGFFWLGAERGIFRVNQADLEAFADGRQTSIESVCYGRDEGLANVEVAGGHQPAAWKTTNGEIWFATSKGAVKVNPTSLQVSTRPPPLILQKILVNDQAVAANNQKLLKLGPDCHKLEFRYTATSFVSPGRVRFRQQLEGVDSGWVEGGTARSTIYSQLAPGNYIFRFTACNSDGVWNSHPVSLAFVVQPAFWQTAWFRSLGLCLFAGIVAIAVRYRYVQKMRRKLLRLQEAHAVEQERIRIARDIHDDLGARLTEIAYLSDMSVKNFGDHVKAGGHLEKIAHGSRHAIRSLEEIVWAINPQKDSLPHLLDYLSHFANEYFRGTDIRCRQDLPLIIPEIPISAAARHHLFLAFKEALNNVRKHAQATEVWMSVVIAPDELCLTIKDNGTGLPATPDRPRGNGLLNMHTRMTALGGSCKVNSQTDQGTQIDFVIKLPSSSFTSTSPQPPAHQEPSSADQPRK